MGSIPQSGRFPWRRKWHPTPGFLPEESHGQRSLIGYSPYGHTDSGTSEVTQHTHAGGSDGNESAFNARDLGSILGSGKSPGGKHGYPLQYACLKNSMNRGAWQVTVQRVAELDTTEVTEHIPPGYLLALASGLITVNLNLISF